MINLDEEQKKWVDRMIKKLGLNEYGDPKGTMYMGGTPLFDERTGSMKDRYDHILDKHKDWLPQSKK